MARSPDGFTEKVAPVSDPAGAPPMAEGDLLAGRFSLRTQIGRGGAGTVFSAFDTKVGQMVAVKILHADIREKSQLERLRREVRASRPGHPNAVAVYDLFDDGRRRFLTMELVDGRSLSLELADLSTLTVDRTIAVGRQIAAALGDLHSKGLVHRDVKPGNILLTKEGTAKLCDMGLTRSIMRGGTITEAEMVVGTPAYMAPEQALAGELTAASDVYALGLTLYQCLTGEVPLQEDTAVATLMLRQRSRAPAVRRRCGDCPTWLDRLLRRILDPEPEERPGAFEVEAALTEQRFRVRFRPRRRHWVAAAIVVLTAAASVAGYRALSERPAASVEVIGSDVVGRDAAGEDLWRRRLDQPRVETHRADLDGNGVDEVLVTGYAEHIESELPDVTRHSEILILDASGRLITRLDPEREIGEWRFRFRLEVVPRLEVLDLDGDGWLEVIANCRQRHFFPTAIMVYWPRWRVWDTVLSHPGSVYAIFPRGPEVDSGFRFFGVNNRMAMSAVLGVMRVTPPDRRQVGVQERSNPREAPPYGVLGSNPTAELVDYVPLDLSRVADVDRAPTLEPVSDSGWRLTAFDDSVELDRYLNAADGPNAGRDLREVRAVFFRFLNATGPGLYAFTSDGVAEVGSRIRTECGPLLADPAYQVVVSDAIGRAYVNVDDLSRAIEVLGPAYERLGNDDLGYRLANIEAVSGDLDAASVVLRRLIDRGTTQRARFDAPQLLLRVAMERRDHELFDSTLTYLNGLFGREEQIAAYGTVLRAGARLWWDETSDADTRVRSTDIAEDGDAVACLARWRQGTTAVNDDRMMLAFIDANPDAAGLGRAALAAALLGQGRASEAIEACDAAIAVLDARSKGDLREHQNIQLTRAIRSVALLESGDRALARQEALLLAGVLDPNLLPGILVGEVLEATSQ